MNAQSLVVERGEAVKRYVAFCGSPPLAPALLRADGVRGKKDYCLWQSESFPSGEQAERAVIDHYRRCHPRLLAQVSSGAMNGRLVGAPDPMVSRVDLEDEEDE